jgi:hypothetical protein
VNAFLSRLGRGLRTALDWIRITNGDGKLSLTNCAVFVAFTVALRSRVGLDWAGFAGLVVALTSYQVKRALVQNATANEADARVDGLVTAVADLKTKLNLLATPERMAAIQRLGRKVPDEIIPGQIFRQPGPPGTNA